MVKLISNIKIYAHRFIEPNKPKLHYSQLLLATAISLLTCYPAFAQNDMRQVRVEGKAMEPILNDGDVILISTNVEKIERGDIVIFWFPDDPSKSFIQRIIGLGGEVIRMDQHGQILINDRLLDEPYVSTDRNRIHRAFPAIYIKPHYYSVMGDNRDLANDSRNWGLVPEKYIWGKFVDHSEAMATSSNAIARKAFSLTFPPAWKIDKKRTDYDPDHFFSIDASVGSSIIFSILDEIKDPTTIVQDYAKSFETMVTGAKRSRFNKWGKYEGSGIIANGKILNLIKGSVRIFVFNQANKTFVIIEQIPDDERRDVSPGFKMIEDSFSVNPPAVR